MGILSWIVFGLVAGVVAKWIMPGQRPGGTVATIVLGILGAVVGGFLGTQLGLGDVQGFDLRSLALAIGGGMVVLLLYGMFTRQRG